MTLFSSVDLAVQAAKPAPAAFSQIPTIGSFQEYGEITSTSDLIRRLQGADPAPWSEMFVSYGAFAMHHLVDVIVREVAGEQALVSIATWAMSEQSARTIAQLVSDGLIANLHLTLDHKIRNRSPEAVQLAENVANSAMFAKCHAKCTVIRSPKVNVTIIGSANYTRNPRMEIGVITSCSQTAAMADQWLKTLVDDGTDDDTL